MRNLIFLLTTCLLSSPLVWGQEPKSILDRGLTPDPDIFDGTFAENWDRDNETSRIARVGETSYGNSLEGKENKVKGWVQQQGDNPGQQGSDPRRQGAGIGTDGKPEDKGGGGAENENPIEQVENPISGGGQEEPQDQQQAGGGGNNEQAQRAGGGSGSNPLEMLKKITSSAQSQKNREQMGSYGEENNEEESAFGNNTYQVEVQEQSADVLGSNPETAEKPEDRGNRNRSAASGRQETTSGGGSETGDDLPSGI